MTKAKFFAAHLGQLFTHPDFDEPQVMTGVAFHEFGASVHCKPGWVSIDNCKLVLKSLSEISDEDAKRVAALAGFSVENFDACIYPQEEFEHSFTVKRFEQFIMVISDILTGRITIGTTEFGIRVNGDIASESKSVDYLRSKGYILPFMGLDPEERWVQNQ